MQTLDTYEKKYKKKSLPVFNVGDTVDVHVAIVEGDKERVQIFNGTVISRRGHGLSEMFTVRRIVQGEGVERIFPIHAPTVKTIKVKRKGDVRRAKLYYLRDRVGKATKVKEKIWDRKEEVTEEVAPEAAVEKPTTTPPQTPNETAPG